MTVLKSETLRPRMALAWILQAVMLVLLTCSECLTQMTWCSQPLWKLLELWRGKKLNSEHRAIRYWVSNIVLNFSSLLTLCIQPESAMNSLISEARLSKQRGSLQDTPFIGILWLFSCKILFSINASGVSKQSWYCIIHVSVCDKIL